MSAFLFNRLANKSKPIFGAMIRRQPLFLLLAVALALNGCDKKAGKDVKDLSEARQEVIKRVEAGAISPDQNGVGLLPAELTSASKGGEIYVSKDPVVGVMIVFVLEGSETNLIGNLYCQNEIPANTSTIRIGASNWIFRLKADKHWAMVAKL